MVRLFMKEEFVSMQDRIIVKNEVGQPQYLIVGKWGRLGDTLSLYSMSGELILEAKQTLLSVFPTFDLLTNQEKVGTIVKKPGIHHPYYRIKKLGWVVDGDFLEQEYSVKKKNTVIMEFEKTASFTGDFYSLNIIEEQHASICCLLAVIIDHYSFNKNLSPLEILSLSSHKLRLHNPLIDFSFDKKEGKTQPYFYQKNKENVRPCTIK